MQHFPRNVLACLFDPIPVVIAPTRGARLNKMHKKNTLRTKEDLKIEK